MAFDVTALLRLWTSQLGDDPVTAFRAVYTDPVTVNGVAVPASDLVRRARSLQAALDQRDHEVLAVVEAENQVALAFRLTGRHVGPLSTALGLVPPTGRTLTLRTIDILSLRDGLIAEVHMVADDLGTLASVGAVRLTATGDVAPGTTASDP